MKELLTKYPARTIVFALTVFAALIDFYAAFILSDVISGFYLALLAIEIPLIWIAYQMLKNKSWALWLMTIYYGLRSFNIETNDFIFYTKNGLNIEIGFGDVVSFNIVSLFCFVLLIQQVMRRKEPVANPS